MAGLFTKPGVHWILAEAPSGPIPQKMVGSFLVSATAVAHWLIASSKLTSQPNRVVAGSGFITVAKSP